MCVCVRFSGKTHTHTHTHIQCPKHLSQHWVLIDANKIVLNFGLNRPTDRSVTLWQPHTMMDDVSSPTMWQVVAGASVAWKTPTTWVARLKCSSLSPTEALRRTSSCHSSLCDFLSTTKDFNEDDWQWLDDFICQLWIQLEQTRSSHTHKISLTAIMHVPSVIIGPSTRMVHFKGIWMFSLGECVCLPQPISYLCRFKTTKPRANLHQFSPPQANKYLIAHFHWFCIQSTRLQNSFHILSEHTLRVWCIKERKH